LTSDTTNSHGSDTLGDLDSLNDFLLHDNRLTPLHASVARLKTLRYLNISDNAFSE
jgi:Leucine-rich repeat (LRR) protein